ncbi:MAG: response regulator receiver protein [Holophagaceae bacterium]|nr:response regulator receiver protein [Holophagaceae bacterium]
MDHRKAFPGQRRFVALSSSVEGQITDLESLGLNLEPDRDPVVLVVDDVSTSQHLLASILRDRGYQVVVANNGPEALERVRATPPDLVLLDIEMPGMDGYEVCLRLKAEEATRDVPVVFITSKAGTEDVIRGFRCGGMDYVTKPFHPLELLARVHTHVTLKRTRDRERELFAALRESQGRVDALSDLLPICAKCRRVRSDGGYWQSVEDFLQEHAEVRLAHGLCPDCIGKGSDHP